MELTERGAVKVDDLLRTTADGIWALGDVNGGPQHTYISLDDYRVVWSHAERFRAPVHAERPSQRAVKHVPAHAVFACGPE